MKPTRQTRTPHGIPGPIRKGFEALCDQLDVGEDFPADVLTEAELVAMAGYDSSRSYADFTAMDFCTIDPPSSTDLDQAMYIERAGSGYTVWYAIADVAAWVKPGGAIDREAHRRGQTLYAPDRRMPLHPPVLSEAAASLLADGTPRPALVWRMDLDESGEITKAHVERGLVRSREKLNYPEEQAKLDAGTANPTMTLLKEVGILRQQVETNRGGVSLNLPEQVVVTDDGAWRLENRIALENEDWNAQISLMTGFSAAKLMLDAGVGVLRTLPPADQHTIDSLRQVARTLGLEWPREWTYAEFVRQLDARNPRDQAMMMSCVRLFRGAGYTVVQPGLGAAETTHGALAASYAHTTAPLRRLVDRYVGEICVAICAGVQPPQWALDALPKLPDEMNESDRRAKAFERGVNDLVEALVLQHRVGETFTGVVIQVDEKRDNQGVISIPEPAIEARVRGRRVNLGDEVKATLTRVDLQQGQVQFEAR